MSTVDKTAPDYAGRTPDTGTPWRVESIPNNTGNRMPTWEVRGPYNAVIAMPADRPHNFANARLIAAAPELLEALNLVAWSGKFDCFDDDAWDFVNAVIARATGAA